MKNYLIESLISILGEEDRGIMFNLTTEEERKVREFIDIDLYNTVDELRILRNYLVMIISNMVKDNQNKIRAYHTYITVITSMIDIKIFELGGEV